ncbi:hypothetical protein J3F84DRAFT_336910 [Trichoderma pleuroticola]
MGDFKLLNSLGKLKSIGPDQKYDETRAGCTSVLTTPNVGFNLKLFLVTCQIWRSLPPAPLPRGPTGPVANSHSPSVRLPWHDSYRLVFKLAAGRDGMEPSSLSPPQEAAARDEMGRCCIFRHQPHTSTADPRPVALARLGVRDAAGFEVIARPPPSFLHWVLWRVPVGHLLPLWPCRFLHQGSYRILLVYEALTMHHVTLSEGNLFFHGISYLMEGSAI